MEHKECLWILNKVLGKLRTGQMQNQFPQWYFMETHFTKVDIDWELFTDKLDIDWELFTLEAMSFQ